MSFSAEMKDFLNAYKTGQSINASRTDQDYKAASTDALTKKTERDNDPEALQLETDTKKQQLANLKSSAGTAAMNAQTSRMGAQDLIEHRKWLRSQGAVPTGTGLMPPTGAVGPQGPIPQGQGALPIGPSTLDDGTGMYADGGLVPDGYETMRQVNVGKKGPKGGVLDPLPETDDNMFLASGKDEKIIRAKRTLRDQLKEREVRGYADGGLVDDDNDGDTDTQGALDIDAPAGAPTDVSARARTPQVPKGLEGVISPALVHDATKAGMTFGIKEYGLGAGGVPSAKAQANARLFAQGHGGLSDQEMQAARQAVDPEGKLTDSQRNMAALGSVYQFWANKGDGEKAQRVAFQMLQHFRNASQRYAAIAAKAAEGGNVDLATKAALKAYANVPDGNDLELLPNPDGGIMYAFTGPNGDVVTKGVATPQQLAASAMGMATGGFDKAILSAAGAREDTAGAVKPGKGPHVATPAERAKTSESIDGAIGKLDTKGMAPDLAEQIPGVAQRIFSQNSHIRPEEAVAAAQKLLTPGSKDPEKPDYKLTMGGEGEDHTVKFNNGLKIKLNDQQLDEVQNAAAARIKQATDKINTDMEAGDTPSRTDQALEGAKQVGKGVLDFESKGGVTGAVARGATSVASKIGDILSDPHYNVKIPQAAKDAIQSLIDEGKARYGSAADHLPSGQGAIPVDDMGRPL